MAAMRRTTRFTRGFTLVELLVVLSIIALLMALLLPSLAAAKAVAFSAKCRSNLHQNHLAFTSYAYDFRDCIPPVGTTYNYWQGTRGATWHQILGKAGYLGGMEQYVGYIQGFALGNTRFRVEECPGEKGSPKPELKGFTYYNNEHAMSSYVMHWSVSGYHYYFGYMDHLYPMWQYFRRGMNEGNPYENIRAADALMVMDGPDWGLTWLLPYVAWNLDAPGSYTGYFDYAFRHPAETSNAMYRDGHVAGIQHIVKTGKPLWKFLWKRCPNWAWQSCTPTDIWLN